MTMTASPSTKMARCFIPGAWTFSSPTRRLTKRRAAGGDAKTKRTWRSITRRIVAARAAEAECHASEAMPPQEEHDHDDHDEDEPAAWSVPPLARIRVVGKRASAGDHGDDEK